MSCLPGDPDTMSPFPKSSLSRSEMITGIVLVLLLCVLAMAAHARIREQRQIPGPVANCRHILLTIRLYAADEGGRYPDASVPGAKDSNTVFRELIKVGSVEDEKFFGCGATCFVPDGNIGKAPDYARAVEPGENHWAMTKGLNDKSPGGVPLVYENPAEATWPPTWNADAAGMMVKGRSQNGGKVIIGTNDTSVQLMTLASPRRGKVHLKSLGSEGLDLFSQWTQGSEAAKYSILDVLWDEDVMLARVAAYNREQSLAKYLRAGAIVVVLALLVLGCWKFKRSRASTASVVH
jgi:hypothetical protein